MFLGFPLEDVMELTAPPDAYLHSKTFKNSIFVKKWTLGQGYYIFNTSPLKKLTIIVEKEEENEIDPYVMVSQSAVDSIQITS